MKALGSNGCSRATRLGDSSTALPHEQFDLVRAGHVDHVRVHAVGEMGLDSWTSGLQVDASGLFGVEHDVWVAYSANRPFLHCTQPIDAIEKLVDVGRITAAHLAHVDRRLGDERVSCGFERTRSQSGGCVEFDFERLHTASHCNRLSEAASSVS